MKQWIIIPANHRDFSATIEMFDIEAEAIKQAKFLSVSRCLNMYVAKIEYHTSAIAIVEMVGK